MGSGCARAVVVFLFLGQLFPTRERNKMSGMEAILNDMSMMYLQKPWVWGPSLSVIPRSGMELWIPQGVSGIRGEAWEEKKTSQCGACGWDGG